MCCVTPFFLSNDYRLSSFSRHFSLSVWLPINMPSPVLSSKLHDHSRRKLILIVRGMRMDGSFLWLLLFSISIELQQQQHLFPVFHFQLVAWRFRRASAFITNFHHDRVLVPPGKWVATPAAAAHLDPYAIDPGMIEKFYYMLPLNMKSKPFVVAGGGGGGCGC